MIFSLTDNYTPPFTINGVQPGSFDFNTTDYSDWLSRTGKALADTDAPLEFSINDFKLNLRPTGATSADMSSTDVQKAFNSLFGGEDEKLTNAQKNLFWGSVLKTVGSASDFFSRATALSMGQLDSINQQRNISLQNYDNQMAALDNQLINLKSQLADRFNKTVETSIMDIAAKNLRVTSGGVLEMNKDLAQEITEDTQMAESNVRLNKTALDAAKKQTKESARYAKFNTISQFIQSAVKLGITWQTGGGTGESWGKLYKGYKDAKALEEANAAQEFNKIY